MPFGSFLNNMAEVFEFSKTSEAVLRKYKEEFSRDLQSALEKIEMLSDDAKEEYEEELEKLFAAGYKWTEELKRMSKELEQTTTEKRRTLKVKIDVIHSAMEQYFDSLSSFNKTVLDKDNLITNLRTLLREVKEAA
jgi:F0F1-type ATP synthase membrane subunit b/b'